VTVGWNRGSYAILHNMFDKHLADWGLTADGDPIATPRSRLLPVRRAGVPAMLKVAVEAEEKSGSLLMAWWDGQGAAKVLARKADAILLERAKGDISLAELARSGRDDDATSIICNVVAMLHAPKAKPLPALLPLSKRFEELEPAAAIHGGILSRSAETARALLASPQEASVLHGDIHHDNILDFGERGWLAIDPKGLFGERGFDYANLFCNPDPTDHTRPVATSRFERRLEIVSDMARLERRRLLQWILAWAGLSAVWYIADGQSPENQFHIAKLAAGQLDV